LDIPSLEIQSFDTRSSSQVDFSQRDPTYARFSPWSFWIRIKVAEIILAGFCFSSQIEDSDQTGMRRQLQVRNSHFLISLTRFSL
jgi:hypothetical protein